MKRLILNKLLWLLTEIGRVSFQIDMGLSNDEFTIGGVISIVGVTSFSQRVISLFGQEPTSDICQNIAIDIRSCRGLK